MSYKAEKEKQDEQLKRIKYVLLSVLLLLVAGLGIFSAIVPAETWKYYFSLPTVSQRQEGELRIHFIDVGQGDCIFVELPDGQTLLIDGGGANVQAEEKMMRYLNALKVEDIDYVFITHTDEDHCGGADKVLLYKSVGQLYLPNVENTQVNVAYAQAYAAAVKKQVPMSLCKRGVAVQSIDEKYKYTFSVIYPYLLSDSLSTDENDLSAVSWLDYQGVSTLFAGDISTLTEGLLTTEDSQGLLDIYGVDLSSTELLKVAHHGSRYSTSEQFLRYLQVKTAIISCGKDNAYGHPHQETLQTLQQCAINVYRTDKRGNIVVTIQADGKYFLQSGELVDESSQK